MAKPRRKVQPLFESELDTENMPEPEGEDRRPAPKRTAKNEAGTPELSRVQQVHQWFKDSADTSDTWRAKAVESYEFVTGDQWTQADLEKITKEKRPALVINKVLSPLLFLMGLQRQQRADAAILPFEPNDARAAEMLSYLLKWYMTRSNQPAVDSHVFSDMVITGLGYWKVTLDFDDEPDGEPRFERLHPLSVYADPNWLDLGWEKANYAIHATWFTEEEATDMWPEHADEIRRRYGEWLSDSTFSSHGSTDTQQGRFAGDSNAERRLWWDKKTQRIRVAEAWYVRRVTVPVAINMDTRETTDDPEEIAQIKAMMETDPMMGSQFTIVRRPVRKIHVASVLADILLDDRPSPFDVPYFPIWPAVAHYFWQRPFGVVEGMKDPQRFYNRHRSTILEIVRRAAHSGWMNKEDGGAKTQDLEENVAGTGRVLNYRDTPPVPIPPPEVPQTLVMLMKTAEQEINDVSSITREMVGTSTQKTVSGRAILARQRGGMVTQEPLLDNFRLFKGDALSYFVRVMQQYTDAAKAARILGALAARDPASPVVGMLQQADGNSMELESILQAALATRFDVVVDPESKTWEPTIKQAQFDLLKELAGQFPTPPDLLIDKAQDAGLITESDAGRWKTFIAQQMGGPPQGAPGPAGAGPPMPGAPPGGPPMPPLPGGVPPPGGLPPG